LTRLIKRATPEKRIIWSCQTFVKFAHKYLSNVAENIVTFPKSATQYQFYAKHLNNSSSFVTYPNSKHTYRFFVFVSSIIFSPPSPTFPFLTNVAQSCLNLNHDFLRESPSRLAIGAKICHIRGPLTMIAIIAVVFCQKLTQADQP